MAKKKAVRKTAKKATRTAGRKKAAKKTTARKTTARKATARKTTARKKVAKKATTTAAKPARITAAAKPRTKSEVFNILAENAGISKKEVASVFETLGTIVKADLSKRGPGAVNVAGLMKVTVQRKPATKARKGINPFTKEACVFKAKPARNVIKIRPMKAVKDLV
ncbi:Histone-like bacterial DNA-binding protein [hydrothermal vent metagenome]|uniref:Histone-like bacterial DNA-binding protein n=1 Tax=hydrothermal vent metagenome TaxID=652676 RepID=A0A3B1D9J6_9ZZZZ